MLEGFEPIIELLNSIEGHTDCRDDRGVKIPRVGGPSVDLIGGGAAVQTACWVQGRVAPIRGWRTQNLQQPVLEGKNAVPKTGTTILRIFCDQSHYQVIALR